MKMLRATAASGRRTVPLRLGRRFVCNDWSPGSESWRAAHPPPRQLTTLLSRAPDAQGLLDVVRVHGEAFNAVHCSALWSRFGHLAKTNRDERQWIQQNEADLAIAREHTLRLIPTFGPRQLANSALGVAHCGFETIPTWSLLWSRIASASIVCVRDLNSQELTNLVWACATARVTSPRLFDALANEVLERMDSLTPLAVSMLAWSFATARHDHQDVLSGLAFAASQRVQEMDSADLARTAWALGRVHVGDEADSFFIALEAELEGRLPHMSTHAIATTAHGLGSSGRASADTLESIALAIRAHHSLKAFSGNSLVTLVAPYALFANGELSSHSLHLLHTLIDHAPTRVDHLQPHALVTLARVLGEAVFRDRIDPDERLVALFKALATASVPRLAAFGERELSLLPWAFCRAHRLPHAAAEHAQLFEALAIESTDRLHEFTARGLCSLAWSFSHAFAGGTIDAGARSGADADAVDSPLPPADHTESAKLELPMAAQVLFGVLSEELAGRRGELSEKETYSCELAFRRLGQPSPFGGLVAAAGETFLGNEAAHFQGGDDDELY